MAEPVIEQITDWINDALDGQQDPDATLTLRSVRPVVLEPDDRNFRHGDVVIEITDIKTQQKTASDSRTELASWILHGVIRELPASTAADTMLARMGETIRRLLLAGLAGGQACGGLALDIDCPETSYELIEGGVVVRVTVAVRYMTALKDGYEAPS